MKNLHVGHEKHFEFGKMQVLETRCFDFMLMHTCDDVYSGTEININTLSNQKKGEKACTQHYDSSDIIMWW